MNPFQCKRSLKIYGAAARVVVAFTLHLTDVGGGGDHPLCSTTPQFHEGGHDDGVWLERVVFALPLDQMRGQPIV